MVPQKLKTWYIQFLRNQHHSVLYMDPGEFVTKIKDEY